MANSGENAHRKAAQNARLNGQTNGSGVTGGELGPTLPRISLSSEQASHVAPSVRAAELPAIVAQSLASHAVVETQSRVTELREEDKRMDAAFEKPPRRFRHHPPAQTQPV